MLTIMVRATPLLQGIQGLNSQLDVAQTYVDGRKAKMVGGAQGQNANHSVNVVGQLKAELLNTTKEFKVRRGTCARRSFSLHFTRNVPYALFRTCCKCAAQN